MGILKKLFLTVIFISLYVTQDIFSQNIGITIGVMRNYSSEKLSNSLYSISPGISLSGKFFSKNINWEMSLSYVKDGLDPDEITSGLFYNSSDYIISPKLIINSKKILMNEYIPDVIAGISYHIVNSEFVYTENFNPLTVVEDKNNERSYFDLGLEQKIAKVIGIDLILRYLSLIPLDKSSFLHNQVKHSFVLSFKY
ncbi:MAG: hypothetical protein PVH88_03595 [Ignavibacteria bacterium]